MIGIIGSGFGLYGYLPAAADSFSGTILLMKRYRETFEGRPELIIYAKRIEWVADLEELVSMAETVILSVTPRLQEEIVINKIIGSSVRNLILEKPVAVSPEAAESLLKRIKVSGIHFRIGYNLFHTVWANELAKLLKGSDGKVDIVIDWTFKAHHYSTSAATWKRNVEEGGGVLRFYGIHLIAVAAAFGYNVVVFSLVRGFSQAEIYQWDVCFSDNYGAEMTLHLNSHATSTVFSVSATDRSQPGAEISICQKDPFMGAVPGGFGIIDPRIDSLKALINSLADRSLDDECLEMYRATNDLWKQVEQVTRFVDSSENIVGYTERLDN